MKHKEHKLELENEKKKVSFSSFSSFNIYSPLFYNIVCEYTGRGIKDLALSRKKVTFLKKYITIDLMDYFMDFVCRSSPCLCVISGAVLSPQILSFKSSQVRGR